MITRKEILLESIACPSYTYQETGQETEAIRELISEGMMNIGGFSYAGVLYKLTDKGIAAATLLQLRGY